MTNGAAGAKKGESEGESTKSGDLDAVMWEEDEVERELRKKVAALEKTLATKTTRETELKEQV